MPDHIVKGAQGLGNPGARVSFVGPDGKKEYWRAAEVTKSEGISSRLPGLVALGLSVGCDKASLRNKETKSPQLNCRIFINTQIKSD